MDIYSIIKEVVGWVSLVMSFYLFYRFYEISKVIDKRALIMVRQLKTMFGPELSNKKTQGKDLLRIQKENRAIIGKTIKSKIPGGLLDDIPDKNVTASLIDRDLMAGTFWLIEKAGGAIGGLKGLISGEERKKKSSFSFE